MHEPFPVAESVSFSPIVDRLNREVYEVPCRNFNYIFGKASGEFPHAEVAKVAATAAAEETFRIQNFGPRRNCWLGLEWLVRPVRAVATTATVA
jgi:hypothetical protein